MSYQKIRDVTLKDGQSADLVMVTAPDPNWRPKLCKYLNSPPQPEGPSLYDFLLTQDLPGLTTRFFVMLRKDEMVGCIVTTDGAKIGYINSTFVPRHMRQQGIASALMAALEDDFAGRGGLIRFFTTRTDSPAETMFEKFGYHVVWERGGRTGMEQHYEGIAWDDYFSESATEAMVTEMTWAHWSPHRALMWTRKGNAYHPLVGDFMTQMRESVSEKRTRFKVLVTPNSRLVGTAVLHPRDWWVKNDNDSYVLDLYVHPRFQAATQTLFSAVMPSAGHVQTFLDGGAVEQIGFFVEQGFQFETSLRDDFNHHDDSTRDIRVYGKTL